MKIAAFISDRRGNISLMFGLMLLPLLGVIGAAVDYTRAADQISRLQAAVDATALNISRLPPTTTAAEIQATADAAIRPYLTSAAVQGSLFVSATRTGKRIDMSASARMPTRFVSLLGIDQVSISATSTAEWGNTRLRVALALDVTGSMASSGKLTAMQTAANNLIDQMQAAAKTDGDVYVSIVPFAKDVNVGSSNYAQSWLKWSGANDTWDENNGSCSVSYTPTTGTAKKTSCEANSVCSNPSYTTQASCTGAGTCSKSGYTTQSACTAAGSCSYTTYTTQTSCVSYGRCVYGTSVYENYSISYKPQCLSYAGTTWTTYSWTVATWTPYSWTQATWTPAAHSTWNGCVMDRDQNYDTTNTAPSSASATLFPAEQYSTCPAQMTSLSSDWTALKAKITSLTANGGTNQQIGLAWAFQSLSASPMSVPTLDPSYTYNQAIILLSDGLNTQNRFYGNGMSYNSQVDDRQRLLCDAVKAAGIKLYTVQVNTDGDPTSTVLQYCASTGKFTQLTTASQIITTFSDIGTELTQLRLTH